MIEKLKVFDFEVFSMNMIYKFIIGWGICISMPTLADDWVNKGNTKEFVSSQGGLIKEVVVLHLFGSSCEAYISFSADIYPYPDIVNVNGVDVKVKFSGRNGRGVPFFMGESAKGRSYILSQFVRKNNVVFKFDSSTDFEFSAIGFNEAYKSKVTDCKGIKKRFENAL